MSRTRIARRSIAQAPTLKPAEACPRVTRGIGWCGLLLAGVSLMAGQVLAEVTLTSSVERRSADALFVEPGDGQAQVVPGDVLRYTIVFSNNGTQDAVPGSIIITNPLPEGTVYLAQTAAGENTTIWFSVDGEHFAAAEDLLTTEAAGSRLALASEYRSIRWAFRPPLGPGQSSQVSFDLAIVALD